MRFVSCCCEFQSDVHIWGLCRRMSRSSTVVRLARTNCGSFRRWVDKEEVEESAAEPVAA